MISTCLFRLRMRSANQSTLPFGWLCQLHGCVLCHNFWHLGPLDALGCSASRMRNPLQPYTLVCSTCLLLALRIASWSLMTVDVLGPLPTTEPKPRLSAFRLWAVGLTVRLSLSITWRNLTCFLRRWPSCILGWWTIHLCWLRLMFRQSAGPRSLKGSHPQNGALGALGRDC